MFLQVCSKIFVTFFFVVVCIHQIILVVKCMFVGGSFGVVVVDMADDTLMAFIRLGSVERCRRQYVLSDILWILDAHFICNRGHPSIYQQPNHLSTSNLLVLYKYNFFYHICIKSREKNQKRKHKTV